MVRPAYFRHSPDWAFLHSLDLPAIGRVLSDALVEPGSVLVVDVAPQNPTIEISLRTPPPAVRTHERVDHEHALQELGPAGAAGRERARSASRGWSALHEQVGTQAMDHSPPLFQVEKS